MTTITKERIELFIKSPLENGLTRGEQMELARIALASLEAEPVAWLHSDNGLGIPAITRSKNVADSWLSKGWYVQPLYIAKPVPVVPDARPSLNNGIVGFDEGWNACRAAMLQSGNFRENKNSSTNNFREIAETSTNYPVIPSEVLSAILKVAKIRADFDDFDGDRRGIGDCLDEAEQELIVTINKYASQLAAEPIATNDVREQTAVPPVPVIQADVAQAIEKLKRKLVECNRYNYCADAVKGVEYACRATMLHGAKPVSQTYKLNKLSGNSPVTPDSWISCSERMPEETGDIIVVSDGIVMSGISYSRRDGFYIAALEYDDDEPIGGVTHWMPLPEPPQEVK